MFWFRVERFVCLVGCVFRYFKLVSFSQFKPSLWALFLFVGAVLVLVFVIQAQSQMDLSIPAAQQTYSSSEAWIS